MHSESIQQRLTLKSFTFVNGVHLTKKIIQRELIYFFNRDTVS